MKRNPNVDEIHLQKAYALQAIETLFRSLFGAIPLVGTALNEAIFDLPARLKQVRLEKFVEELDRNLRALEADKIDTAYIKSEEFVDFLEDVLIRASKTRAEEKRKKLAAVLAGRLQHAKSTPFDDRFLDLLLSLTEIQVRILAEHLRAAEKRENSNQDTAEASTEHRQPGYYDLPDSDYYFLVQDLISKALLYTRSVGRGNLGVFQFLEVTELGRAFIRFLEENHV